MLTLLLFSIALASDVFAVALARGACSDHQWKKALFTGLIFGLAQSGAAILGWSIGSLLTASFHTLGNYIACAALVILGAMMIRSVFLHQDEPVVPETHRGTLRALTGLLIAALVVSVDCLAAGVALPLLGFTILFDALIIFIISFLLSLLGFFIGSKIGQKLGKYAEVGGGLILMGIGFYILA